MRRWLWIALVASAGLLAAVAVTLAWGWKQLSRPLDLPSEAQLFEVERGASLARVTRELELRGFLQHPRLLDWYAGARGLSTAIQAGEYELETGITGIGLLDKLVSGEVYLHQFTIVEGLRFQDVLARLRSHPAIDPTTHDGEAIMAAIGAPEWHPEGQFLPDTYLFPRGTTDVEVLRRAHGALWELVDDIWDSTPPDDILTEPYQGLILASIIEKETALDSERGIISGVLHERLRRNMRLQVDPTVIYGLGDAFDGDLTRSQLDADTPYNTYTRRGLPPTPIALAGIASIEAAFAPIETGAIYFVATGEPDGSHVFSRTLEEHNAAVARYLERQRSNR